jgi:hypothetical protein
LTKSQFPLPPLKIPKAPSRRHILSSIVIIACFEYKLDKRQLGQVEVVLCCGPVAGEGGVMSSCLAVAFRSAGLPLVEHRGGEEVCRSAEDSSRSDCVNNNFQKSTITSPEDLLTNICPDKHQLANLPDHLSCRLLLRAIFKETCANFTAKPAR